MDGAEQMQYQKTFVRHADGSYDLHQIGTVHPRTRSPLIATRGQFFFMRQKPEDEEKEADDSVN